MQKLKILQLVKKPLSLQMKKIVKSINKPLKKKDAAIALLNDDLKNCEHDNVALQAQRDVYKEQLQKCQDIITHLKIQAKTTLL